MPSLWAGISTATSGQSKRRASTSRLSSGGAESVEEARDGEDELVGDHEPDQDHRQHEGDGEDELESGFAHAARRERRGRTRTIR